MEVRQRDRASLASPLSLVADFLSFQRLVSWIQEQLDPRRIAPGNKSKPAVPLVPDPVVQVTKQREALTTWLGATPPILAPPATNSAAPKAATGSAKRTAKRAVDIITNNGCRNVEVQVQVLRQQHDPTASNHGKGKSDGIGSHLKSGSNRAELQEFDGDGKSCE
jgi:hypothetical protein